MEYIDFNKITEDIEMLDALKVLLEANQEGECDGSEFCWPGDDAKRAEYLQNKYAMIGRALHKVVMNSRVFQTDFEKLLLFSLEQQGGLFSDRISDVREKNK